MDEENGTPMPPPQAPAKYAFFGSYGHSLDAKGRIIIPNAYREALGETFTIGPTKDFRGVALYPDPVYDQILADIQRMNQRKPDVQRFATQFFKLSYREIQSDQQGRILLPTMLRQRMLENAKELEISGAFDHIRIEDSARATQEDQYFSDNLDSILEALGNLDD